MKKVVNLLCLVCVCATINATAYKKLTDIDQLSDGDTVVFINETAQKVNGAFEQTSATRNKYLLAVDAVVKNDTAIATGALEFVLGKSGTYWTLTSTQGRKLAQKSKNDYMSAGTSDVATHKIEFYGSDYKVKVENTQVVNSVNYYIRYNANSFRYYKPSSAVSDAYLYRRIPAGQGPNIAVTRVEINPSKLVLRVGENATLEAIIMPEDAKNKTVSWGTLNQEIAIVDSHGEVSAVGVGSTKIWVTTEDGNRTDTCEVSIKASLNLPNVTWNIVQSADSLKEGVRVFIGNTTQDYVCGMYDYNVSKSNIHAIEATYGPMRHTITVSQSYAYTVHECGNGQLAFVDIDGRYLYMHDTNKNLSANDTLDNKAKWKVTINDSVATIKSVYSSQFQILYNKTAANPLFCSYSNYDSNFADIYLYADNAPEWKEPELYPELTLLIGTDTIDSLINIGTVLYDDTWGTESDPYCQSKSVTIVATDIRQPISLSLAKGKVFTLTADELPAKGGSFSISFSTKDAGSYTDTLTLTCGDIIRKIVVCAKTATEEEIKPQVNLSTKAISLNINITEDLSDINEFTFSTRNLQKPLYIKWEKGAIPDRTGELVEIVAGKENAEIYFGSATKMDTVTRTDEEVMIAVDAYTPGTYVSTLCFYSPDKSDKSKNAFEERVTVTIKVTDTPTNLNSTQTDEWHGTCYNLLGQPVDKSYHGLVIRHGKKVLQ